MATNSGGPPDATQHLRDLEVMLNAILDYEIITVDSDGRVASWSPGAEVNTGYSADEVIGQSISLFHTDEDNAEGIVEQELQTARETGRYEFEGWRTRKGGQKYWASVVLAPIKDETGN